MALNASRKSEKITFEQEKAQKEEQQKKYRDASQWLGNKHPSTRI